MPNKQEALQNFKCRESREVPFYPKSDIWQGVRDRIISSADVDDNMQFDPPDIACLADVPSLTTPSVLPYHRQKSPKLHKFTSVPPQRNPLKGVDTNVAVLALGKDIRSLENENNALRKQVIAQETIIRGFCKLYVNKENNTNKGN